MVVQAACLVEGSSQHHYRHYYHRRAVIIIIIGFIFSVFSGGGVRGGLNWAVTVGSCGGEGYNGGVGQ